MALPSKVQALNDAADALLAAVNQPPAESASLESQANLPPQPPELAPAVPQPQEPAVPPEAVPSKPSSTPDPWEARYKSLKGLFDKEVPTLQNQVRTLSEKAQQTEQQLEALRKAPTQPAEQPKPPVDPRDVESFGSDLVDMVQRVTTSMVAPMVSRLDTVIAAFEQRMQGFERDVQGTTQAVAVTAEQGFFDRLTKLVPNWEDINASEGFLTWLAEADPVYGQPRQSALDAAQQSLNSDRAAAVFRAYEPATPATPKSNPLDKQVSPRAVANTAPQSVDKPIVTQQQITAFYNEQARGKYRGREDEAAAIEQVINTALAENRVR